MIRLQFVLGHDWSSRAIAWFSQGGHLSHVDIVMPDGQLLGARSDVVGGKPAGVQIRPYGYERPVRKVVFEVPATPAQEAAFYAFLQGQIGKPYDKMAIVAFVVGRDWREQDAWFCSELATAALEVAGIAPRLFFTANKVTPGACALVCSALGGVTRS